MTTTSNGKLFGRAYSLTIIPPSVPGDYSKLNKGTAYGNTNSKAPIRIGFDINQNNKPKENKGKFELYNLSLATRQSIGRGAQIVFDAGYQATHGVVFSGLVKQVHFERRGPDIVTILEADDGGSNIICSHIDQHFPRGSTWATIVQAIATAMGTPYPYNPVPASIGGCIGVPSFVFPRGFVAHGKCSTVLTTLCRKFGLDWFILNGAINIVPQTMHNGDTAVLISSKTGMIGVPSRSTGSMIKFTSLLNPKLVPARLVQLVSVDKTLNGYYKVLGIKVEGDTHDSKWQTECECIALASGGAKQTAKVATGGNIASGES